MFCIAAINTKLAWRHSAFVTSRPCPYLTAIYDVKQRTSRVVTTSVRPSVCSLVMAIEPSVRFSCNSVRELFIKIRLASARCVAICCDGYALFKDVVTQCVPSFRISWAVWVKLGNYGFRGTPTGESQTSLAKEQNNFASIFSILRPLSAQETDSVNGKLKVAGVT